MLSQQCSCCVLTTWLWNLVRWSTLECSIAEVASKETALSPGWQKTSEYSPGTHTKTQHHISWGKSVNSGLDYWTGLQDWSTGLTFDLNCSLLRMLAMPSRMQPHFQAGTRHEDIMDAKQQSHETQSVCFCASGNTHTQVQPLSSVHMETCWKTMIRQVRIADWTLNYSTYTLTYI